MMSAMKNPVHIGDRNFGPELHFNTSRSSGPGGQHVNKTETRVELRFNIPSSLILSEREKTLLMSRLSGRLTQEGDLIVVSQDTRSQQTNREIAIERFLDLITENLKPERKRKPTKVPQPEKEKRLDEKKRQSEKKRSRQDPGIP